MEDSGLIPVAERYWKYGHVGDPGVVELADHFVADYAEGFKGEDAVCVTGHEEAVVADVGAHVEEVHRLSSGAECVGDCTQETNLMELKGAVVEDIPVDEVGQVAGVGVAEEGGLEGVRSLAVGMREGPEDSVAAAKPLLTPNKL